MKKKLLSALLVLTMLLTAAPAGSAAPEGYPDLDGHWAKEPVLYWTGRGVLNGYPDGTFRPEANITRGELCAVLDRLMGYTETGEDTFPDLRPDAWYYTSVLRLAHQGVLTGDEHGARPDDPILRQEAYAMLCRAYGIASAGEAATGFLDDAYIAAWARGYIGALKAAGHIQGTEQNLIRPTGCITRAEVAQVLKRLEAGRAEAQPSPTPPPDAGATATPAPTATSAPTGGGGGGGGGGSSVVKPERIVIDSPAQNRSVELYAGFYCEKLEVAAHVEKDGKPVQDRVLSYRWEMTGGGKDNYFQEGQNSSAAIPALGLPPGDYTYRCTISAEGCDPVVSPTVRYVVRSAPRGLRVDLSQVKFSIVDGGAALVYNIPDQHLRPPLLTVEYGTRGQQMYLKERLCLPSSSLDLYDILDLDMHDRNTTFNYIKLTPYALDGKTVIGEPVVFDCGITVTNEAGLLPAGKDSFVYDAASGRVVFRDVDYRSDYAYSVWLVDFSSGSSWKAKPRAGELGRGEVWLSIASIRNEKLRQSIQRGGDVLASVDCVKITLSNDRTAAFQIRRSGVFPVN